MEGMMRKSDMSACAPGHHEPFQAITRVSVKMYSDLQLAGSKRSGYHHGSASIMASDPNAPPSFPVPAYRPVERFWPYVELPEQPTDEELAALSPELSEALFGTPRLPFSVTIEFPVFAAPDYAAAVAMAPRWAESGGVGGGEPRRHRARFYPRDAVALRDL